MLHSRIEGIGKPLLIIHGFLGMSDNWKSFSALYAAEGFQVHILDLRNHGKSFHSDEFNYTVMSNDILEYCQHYDLTNISIIGHSMGGGGVLGDAGTNSLNLSISTFTRVITSPI